jgi:hypothetical protein
MSPRPGSRLVESFERFVSSSLRCSAWYRGESSSSSCASASKRQLIASREAPPSSARPSPRARGTSSGRPARHARGARAPRSTADRAPPQRRRAARTQIRTALQYQGRARVPKQVARAGLPHLGVVHVPAHPPRQPRTAQSLAFQGQKESARIRRHHQLAAHLVHVPADPRGRFLRWSPPCSTGSPRRPDKPPHRRAETSRPTPAFARHVPCSGCSPRRRPRTPRAKLRLFAPPALPSRSARVRA